MATNAGVVIKGKGKGSAPKKKVKGPKKLNESSSGATGKPKFPYATKPNSLRRFLELVPRKPRPPKVNAATLKAWGLKDTNDQTIIRVLKALDLVGSDNLPTNRYTEFMSPDKGPGVLAAAIRDVWAPLFEASHEPHRENDDVLRNYFNIHSGGSEATIAAQIQTFKAACDHADFGAAPPGAPAAPVPLPGAGGVTPPQNEDAPVIHIDLHIHLPENKTRRDYEYMFEDIERYILGRKKAEESGDEQ